MINTRVLLALLLFFGVMVCDARAQQQGCCSGHGGVDGNKCKDGTPLSDKCKVEGAAVAQNPSQVLTSSRPVLPDISVNQPLRLENEKSVKELIEGGAPSVNAMVCRVEEADTVELCSQEKVRLIGVDTPEKFILKKLEGDTERAKAEAAVIQESKRAAVDFITPLCEGKQVRVDFDVERKDPDGRLLGYVYLADETFVNAEFIRQGYAFPVAHPSNVKYADLFQKYYQEAKEAKRGLWTGKGAVLLEELTLPPPELIGEWDDFVDEDWSRKVKIIQENDKIYAVSSFADGSLTKQELTREKKDGRTSFHDYSSPTGDYCVIDSTGNLELYDNEGFIREAKKAQ